jgi:hypothetical protein
MTGTKWPGKSWGKKVPFPTETRITHVYVGDIAGTSLGSGGDLPDFYFLPVGTWPGQPGQSQAGRK